jgi:DNA repair protein SbcC/Rad50
MIVQSVRLKNIKSYGEGPDGDGVTISFEPGTNRIAGKNGHGKTTLIESLGYALFLTEPICEENFQLDTYFLRSGQKAAEIDVTFCHRGESYRIERGLGLYSKRQTKVVQPENGSTCAEGEREVSAFLCRLFDLPDPKRFSELFWKLIGVRQGRLTWPFDSKPSAAKDFFEPLLDVEVFRGCFQSLKPAVDEFMARLHEQEILRASVEERIRERVDSAAMLVAKRLQFREIELRLLALGKAREDISKRLAQLAAMEISLRAAESQRDAAQNALGLARQQREISEKRMRESAEAAAVIALAVSGYNSFGRAETALHALRSKQAEQQRLEREIADAEKKRIEFDGKSNAARSQTDIFARQKQGNEAERVNIRERVEALRNRLCASQPEFEKEKSLANCATYYLSDIRHFVSSFAALLAHGETTLQKMKEMTAVLAARDASALEMARHQEETAGEALQYLRQRLAAANAERSGLLKQLQEIAGGTCPFLKEQCRQFDPSKVEGDLKEKIATIELLQKKRGIAESALHAAQTEHEHRRQEEQNLAGKRSQLDQIVVDFVSAFERLAWRKTGEAVNGLQQWIQVQPRPQCPSPDAKGVDPDAFESSHRQNVDYLKALENWWQRTENVVQARINAVREEERRRNSDQRDEVNSTEHLRRIESEIGKIAVAENEQREAAAACQRESAELEKAIAGLDQRLRAFGFLSDEIVLLEETQRKYRSDYQRYLGAKPLADERSSREIELNVRREEEEHAAAELRLCESTLLELSRSFDEAAFAAVRREFEEMNAAIAAESANLENARRETDREESRFREWEEACARRDEIVRVVQRLQSAIKLTELARLVLRDSAPIVAQQLCDRIAAQAQRIFNRINHDPVELRWEAAPRYSLRVIPGDRRFAMLSGGEQTKLALAMTLAMIQEFSGLRFCVFDEPTYGVDAESREKLGDALLESQKAAELEQLILVSHDDAFDGKIEHSIFLRKTAAEGTEVVQFARHVNIREGQNSIACGT